MGAAGRHIAIIGTGPIGISIAKRLILAGHTVAICNSRGPGSLREEEKTTGASAMETPSAVASAEIVILAVPMGRVTSLKPMLDASLQPDAILIDGGNYYPSRDSRIKAIDDGMAETTWVSQTLSRPVIKAFNNIIAVNIVHHARERGSPDRSTLPVSGENDKAKAVIMDLVDQIGFDAYDAGELKDSWRFQPGTPAYCTEPTTEQLIKLLAVADREKAVRTRDSSREIVEKLPPSFNPDTLLRVARLSAGLDRWDVKTWLAAVEFLWAVIKIKLRGQ